MYVDKLDGRIDVTFFDRKASEWRAEQHRIRQTIQTHQTANESYFDEGLRLLELARRAHMLFRQQPANEKRRLLDFVVSNCKGNCVRPTANRLIYLLSQQKGEGRIASWGVEQARL
jgi:site-specific DNA recombinase